MTCLERIRIQKASAAPERNEQNSAAKGPRSDNETKKNPNYSALVSRFSSDSLLPPRSSAPVAQSTNLLARHKIPLLLYKMQCPLNLRIQPLFLCISISSARLNRLIPPSIRRRQPQSKQFSRRCFTCICQAICAVSSHSVHRVNRRSGRHETGSVRHD